MQVKVDPLAARPRVEQLTDGIQDWIVRHGVSGERLPSIRRLAATHGVSRNTVIEAYERLVALGWIVSRPGSGFYVADGAVDDAERGARSGMADVSDEMWNLFQEDGESLRLGCGWLPNAWRDEDLFGHALRQVTRQSSAGLFEYGTPLGSPELRALLQERLRRLAIEVDANQLLMTGGGSQALDVIVRWLLRPGDTVIVESPGYYNLFGLLHLHRVNVVGVRRTEEGPDPEHLETLLERHSPKLFFCHSVLHNPTGTTLSAAVARRVLALAERHDLRIVEDDIYADFQPTPTPRLAALDGLQRVLYVGSFSKTLSCSLRVGFIAAPPELLKPLVDVKMLSNIATSPFAEQVVATLLRNGSYRRLTEKLYQRLSRRMVTALALARDGGWETYATPQGGMFLWARHPDVASSRELVASAGRRGIRLSPGDVFLPEANESPWIRLNVAYVDDPRARAFLDSPR
ncbi:PLP-dependent aminotransferase family protein [Billgrantia gudaonensis]|uniref:DNA-binding transcriptional regulator, MocR family, contains an aminotransferase domain n=1 Tax=Billgrantia gudaonensis TaxID=376427 RepID=A0A1G8MVU8_9GAMM|nr:PLP-dependent aminotransferase family protein [Halomonas gudaonensis]SDI71957.1 DNA-binding transcriptional regulator, MocR family, contains an aminotransferase domain [Halomonas gudaonensis]